MYVAGRPNQRSTAICLTLLPGVLGGCLLAFLPTNAKVGKLVSNTRPCSHHEFLINRSRLAVILLVV